MAERRPHMTTHPCEHKPRALTCVSRGAGGRQNAQRESQSQDSGLPFPNSNSQPPAASKSKLLEIRMSLPFVFGICCCYKFAVPSPKACQIAFRWLGSTVVNLGSLGNNFLALQFSVGLIFIGGLEYRVRPFQTGAFDAVT